MRSVRVRTTAAAVAVVGLALVIGAVALVVALRVILTREIESAAELRGIQIAGLLEAGSSPEFVAAGESDEGFVQVLDRNGTVVAASPELAGQPAVARLSPGETAHVDVEFEDDEFLTVATDAGGRFTVLTARSLDPVAESTQAVTLLLAAGLPVMLLVMAGTAWRVVGRALAPVEAIRGEVDEISAAELHRRVPQPPGRDEIARLAATMNRMLDRLQRAQDRQRRFVSDASHELRSPVAAIRQHAEVALAHPGRITLDGLAETALGESLRMQRLVDDLLLLARVDEHTLQLRRQATDLDDLVFEEARRLRTGGALTVDSAGVSAARVDGDTMALRRALRNIADNAARHARGRVAFGLGEQDGWAVLHVDDDGPGIPTADRVRVFDRFVRLDDARARDTGGGGLGLAIVAEIVAAHDGQVEIADSPLGGARVTVRLRSGSVQPAPGTLSA
ncbi:sensor histidine kinase [Phytohabitans rumicis]|uniref:histidine kinase n=1 Tax=Phytohabitans rumicis TaxID=1076125 RepID=A0A6V8LE48_9ACTN|nr:HAMP domain-containing sensor histidine kinase [Phytohabitans rumicis]GFJ92317.1 two-component sensor histidine kinase [Phytohabitans rumicis]